VSNLLEILAACPRRDPATLAFNSYSALKAATVDAVVETLRPVREGYAALDPYGVRAVLAAGARRARDRGTATARHGDRATCQGGDRPAAAGRRRGPKDD
jgi:tryptophanyl-tRNA synthetase